jgi:LysR family nitrogen assimilation transcriptional regulator
MELRQLRYFIGVSEAGGVLAASRTLHVAQPALSQHIAALEDELGCTLFVRTNRGMTLTEAGRTLIEHARVVLADVERAKSAVRNISASIHGNVVVGLPTTVAMVATLPILQATRERFPDIRLKLVESHSGFLREWLQEGRLDLAMLFASTSDPAIEQRPLLEERLVLVSQPSRAPQGREVSMQSLASRALVLPSKEHGFRRIIDEACARAGVELDVVAEIDSLPNIKKAVQAGVACTILSPGSVAEEVAAGTLSMVTLGKPHLSRKVTCATCVMRPITPAAAAMISLITEQIHRLVKGGTWPARWIAGS